MAFQNLTGRGTPPPERHSVNTLTLSELPEPPIPVSEIGPIPPPPMFSSPSPTMLLRQGSGIHNAVPLDLSDFAYEGESVDWRTHADGFSFFLNRRYFPRSRRRGRPRGSRSRGRRKPVLSGPAAGPEHRHLQGRGNSGEGTEIPCDAFEVGPQEKRHVGVGTRDPARDPHAGKQASSDQAGALHVFQVSTHPEYLETGPHIVFSSIVFVFCCRRPPSRPRIRIR